MFQRLGFARNLIRLSCLRLNQELHEGFFYIANKAKDLDIASVQEPLEQLRLTLTRQDEVLFKEEAIRCVSIRTPSGQMSIFPGHTYKIAQITPSWIVMEFLDGTNKRFFTSGGFAHINNEGSCDINTVECIPAEDIDLNLVSKRFEAASDELQAAQTPSSKAVAEIRIEILKLLNEKQDS